jgi:hypothetical protein
MVSAKTIEDLNKTSVVIVEILQHILNIPGTTV